MEASSSSSSPSSSSSSPVTLVATSHEGEGEAFTFPSIQDTAISRFDPDNDNVTSETSDTDISLVIAGSDDDR